MHTQAELIDWIRDAYAMEKALETALKKLTDPSHTHLALREKASIHCAETHHHASVIAACLKRLGADTSSLKTVLTQGMDFMRNAGLTLGRDERLKDVLTVLVTEHFEIACLTILRTGAARLGRQDIVCVCDDILVDEKRMTRWLQIHLPQIMAAYLIAVAEPAAATMPAAADECSQTQIASSNDERVPQWEFMQIAQTASFIGAQPHTHTFASMSN